MPYDVAQLIERGHSERLVAFIDGGMRPRPCPWCGRGLRPCNLSRHVAAVHFRQLTIDDVLADVEAEAKS